MPASQAKTAEKKETKSRFYPADDIRIRKKRTKKQRPTKIRRSIKPGTVLVLLAGRFRGKRVVNLKTLDSGLLLVTGPYQLNGVPLRRVNQRYVIATSTRVNISKLAIPEHINDAYFKKEKKKEEKKTADGFFAEEKKKKKLPQTRVADQKTVDTPILETLKKDRLLATYIGSLFSLAPGQYPHQIRF